MKSKYRSTFEENTHIMHHYAGACITDFSLSTFNHKNKTRIENSFLLILPKYIKWAITKSVTGTWDVGRGTWGLV